MTVNGPTSPSAAAYAFGGVVLDLERFELWREGVRQHVEPQVLEVLAYLLRCRDRLVSKQELMDAVWHDRFVSDSAVTSRIKAARRITGDDGARQAVIRTVHGRGYRFVAPVSQPSGRPPQTGARVSAPGALRTIACVGRDRELAALRAALTRAGAGTRSVVFVSGEPGVGKTTLLEAFLAEIGANGLVGVGQSHPVAAGEPYAPVLDALFELAKGPSGADVRRCLDQRAPAWLLQLPAFVDVETAETLAARTLGSTPQRMLREALDLLDVLAALDAGPLVLVLEDLHWADEGTLDLVSAIARRRRSAPLLLIGSYRHTDLDDTSRPGHILASTVSELIVRGLAEDLRLTGLSLQATMELLVTRDRPISSGAVPALHRRSGGNPLFLGALVDGEDGRSEPNALPRSLREIVEGHLDRLDEDDHAMLETASVAGTEFPIEVLGSGPQLDAAARRCAVLANRDHLIIADPDRPGRFHFRHALYQEVTYARLPPARSRALHQAVGERLEALPATSPAELAEHFTRAGDGRRSIRYRLEAAGVAAARNAPAAALSHLDQGLGMLAVVPGDGERCAFEATLLASAAAMRLTVEGFGSARAEEDIRRARELYLQVHDTASAFRTTYMLAGLYEYRGEFDRSEALMRPRLADGVDDEGTLVALHDILACSTFHLGEFATALRHAEQAVSRYDAERDRAALAAVGENVFVTSQHWAAYCLWFTGRERSALERSKTAVEVARRPDHAFSLCLALELAAVLHQHRGDVDRVRKLAGEMATRAVEGGLPYREATAGILLGWAHAADDPGKGLRQIEESLAAYRRTGAAIDLPYFLVLQADVARRAGLLDVAERAVREARSLTRTRPSFMDPEVERVDAAILRDAGSDTRTVEAHLRTALDLARNRSACALELRAAADLRRLQLATGRPSDAETSLRTVLESFPAGADTRDLRDAAALLAPTS